MNKKGFTLIELLAVIVILAIIALIATPIILEIIQDAKEESDKRSVELYANSIKNSIVRKQLSGNKVSDGVYDITSEGDICLRQEDASKPQYCIDVEVDGNKPTKGQVTIIDGSIADMEVAIGGKNFIIDSTGKVEYKLAPGLYDKDGTLLASWDKLVKQGMNVEKNYTLDGYKVKEETYPGGIIDGYETGVKLVIDDTVTIIGSTAFAFTNNLTEVVIPNSVTSIGNQAFYSCDSLTRIKIPNSVTTIGIYAFSRSGLTELVLPNKLSTISNFMCQSCEDLKSVTIPNSVTTIGIYAFYNCESLTSITIPNSVTSIGEEAFYGCVALTDATISGGLEVIPTAIFQDCPSLKNVTIMPGVTSIGEKAFNRNVGLTNIEIPSTVTSIGSKAFLKCSNLSNIEIPNSVTSIGSQAFQESGLTKIIIPESVTTIGEYAFYVTSKLSEVYFEHTDVTKYPSIGGHAFSSGIAKTFYFKNSNIANKFESENGTKQYYSTESDNISDNYNW